MYFFFILSLCLSFFIFMIKKIMSDLYMTVLILKI